MSEAEQQIGPWTLVEKLGSGGNATVWRARKSPRSRQVALKVVNTRRSDREPYRRFVREIEFLRSLDDLSWVLPVIEAYLPPRPTRNDRPWLAMPIATPILEALSDAPLEGVVNALAEIAETLARLRAKYQVAHRDIKPNNLYELAGEWLIGDFGLIALPDVEELTRHDRPLGPAHYTAYEMIRDPASADPFPADVYSFGKTLWVLATGQTYPPEGHQPAGIRGFSIADSRSHPHAEALDRLVDLATRLHPEERPEMAEIASDLRAWRKLATESNALDLGDRRGRLRERMAQVLAAEDLLDQRKEMAYGAVRRMNELFAPLNTALKDVHPRAQIDITADQYTQNVLSTMRHLGSREIVFKFQRLSQITSGPDYLVYALRMGRSIELTDDGDLIMRTHIDVGHPTMSGSAFTWESDHYTARVGSVQADVDLQELVDETAQKLAEAIDAFIENLPEDR